jgi:hypothetical protein
MPKASFRPLPQWGKTPRTHGTKTPSGGAKRFAIRKSLNYTRIRAEVLAAIASLPADQRNSIPAAGTLPEQMIGLALAWLGYLPGLAQAQITEGGGRLRVGGAVVDWILSLGSQKIAIRAVGVYWHSLPGRAQKDIVQYDRLHQLRYLVVDILDNDIYLAWTENRLQAFVAQKILEAA